MFKSSPSYHSSNLMPRIKVVNHEHRMNEYPSTVQVALGTTISCCDMHRSNTISPISSQPLAESRGRQPPAPYESTTPDRLNGVSHMKMRRREMRNVFEFSSSPNFRPAHRRQKRFNFPGVDGNASHPRIVQAYIPRNDPIAPTSSRPCGLMGWPDRACR
jgi:hypothetical protein